MIYITTFVGLSHSDSHFISWGGWCQSSSAQQGRRVSNCQSGPCNTPTVSRHSPPPTASPCIARRAGTSPGPSPWGLCTSPCTRSSLGPRSFSLERSDTPCSSAGARHPLSPVLGRSREAVWGPLGTCMAWWWGEAELWCSSWVWRDCSRCRAEGWQDQSCCDGQNWWWWLGQRWHDLELVGEISLKLWHHL